MLSSKAADHALVLPPAGRVIVVGSLNIDSLFRVRRLPSVGETVLSLDDHELPGGKGANQAVAAARAGARVAFVGACGKDEHGAHSIESLRAEGIDVSAVKKSRHHRTGRAIVVVADGGENQIVVAPGANFALDGRSVSNSLGQLELSEADVVLVSFEIPESAAIAAVQAGVEGGSSVIINPAPARDLNESMLGRGVVLTPNTAEALALSGRREVGEAARHLRHLTGGAVVVTRGEDGVLLQDRSGAHHIPALACEAVDTTGAGDAFSGVLAARLSLGVSVSEAATYGVAAASLSVRAKGARQGIPRREEIDRVIRDDPAYLQYRSRDSTDALADRPLAQPEA